MLLAFLAFTRAFVKAAPGRGGWLVTQPRIRPRRLFRPEATMATRERKRERERPGTRHSGRESLLPARRSRLLLHSPPLLSLLLSLRLWKVGSRRCHESVAWSRWKCTGGTRESSRIRRGYLAGLTRRRCTYILKRGNCVVRKVWGFEVGKISDRNSICKVKTKIDIYLTYFEKLKSISKVKYIHFRLD